MSTKAIINLLLFGIKYVIIVYYTLRLFNNI